MPEWLAALQSEHDRAWELINALTAGSSDDPAAAPGRRRLARTLVRLLSAHELSEELVIWPAVQRSCRDGSALAAVALEQEHHLKRALNELSGISPSSEFDECVNTLAGELRAHLSYEQSQVWPRLSDSLEPDEADRLAERWQAVRASAPTGPHPHLSPDPRLLGVAMPVLAIADRALDAVRARMPVVGA